MTSHGGSTEGSGRLYVVATPIGNLGDITLRALETLRTVAVIFAEDTRNTAHLLSHHGIRATLRALHEHNEPRAAHDMLDALRAGAAVALVSDAGTPAISDPGAHAVAAVRAAGFPIVAVPGPSAAIAALSIAGLPGPFAFVGFLPPRAAARRKVLATWRTFAHTLIFYEAPHRIVECVADLASELGGERTVVLARELTKLFESVQACPLRAATAWLEGDPNRIRGEFVVLVEGAPPAGAEREAEAERVLSVLRAELPVKQAVKLAAEITGARRNDLYARALAQGRADE